MPPLTEHTVRQIIRQELAALIRSDRYTFEKPLQLLDGRDVQLGTTTGTKIGTASDQKLGFYNTTPVVQPSSNGETAGFTANAGTAVQHNSRFTGNTGTIDYTISDIVKHLKTLGLIDA